MIRYSFLIKVVRSEASYTSSRNLNSKKTAKLSRKHEKHEEQRINKQLQHLRGNNRTWNIMTSCNLRVLPLLKTWDFSVQLSRISNTISRCIYCISRWIWILTILKRIVKCGDRNNAGFDIKMSNLAINYVSTNHGEWWYRTFC